MNKKFENYFLEKGFKISGNNAYGMINGYDVNAVVRMMDNKSPLIIHFSTFASNEKKRQIVNEMRNEKIKYLTPDSDSYGVFFGINDLTVGKLLKRLDEVIEKVVNILEKNEALPSTNCPICGKELIEGEFKKYNLEGFYVNIDNECAENISQLFEEENADYEKAPNNYLRGMLGAFVGLLAGAVSYVILFFLNFISSISAFLAVWLGALLYQKFGGKKNKVMILIVSVFSVLGMVLTLTGIYVWVADVVALEYGVHSSGLEAFLDMMTVEDFYKEYTTNLVLTLLFTLLGCGYEIYALSKNLRTKRTIS